MDNIYSLLLEELHSLEVKIDMESYGCNKEGLYPMTGSTRTHGDIKKDVTILALGQSEKKS